MYRRAQNNKIISAVLIVSSGFSISLMGAGLILFLSGGRQAGLTEDIRITGLSDALTGSVQHDPVALMTMGIIVLIATPFIRVVGAFFSFWFIEKDKVYALISLGVLIILAASLLVPGNK